MIVTSKNLLLLFGFLVTQLLLVLSFNTSFEIISIALYLLFLFVTQYLTKIKLNLSTKELFVLAVLTLILLISSSFSHSFAFTIEYLVFYTALILNFVFFRNLAFQNKKLSQLFLFGVVLLGIVLALFYFAFLLIPEAAFYLPPLNAISLEYGHSHLAAVLLLIIPLSVWVSNSQYLSDFKRPQLLPVLFGVVMVFTIGRLALILITIFFLHYYLRSKSKSTAKFIKFYFPLSILLVMFVSFSNYFCSIQTYPQQFCKPIIEDNRLYYFTQATAAFVDNILTGYGPGTYELIVERYQYVPTKTSIFAHNFFLQTLAETGIFYSVLIIGIFGYFFLKSIKLIQTKPVKNLQYFVAWGYILVFINSLFDLDWNIFFTMNLSMIFMALLSSRSALKEAVVTICWRFLVIIIVAVAVVNILTKLILTDGHINLAIRLNPYVFHQTRIGKSDQLTTQSREVLFEVYENHPRVLEDIATDLSVDEQLKVYSHLETISPWIVTSEDYLKFLHQNQQYDTLGRVAYAGVIKFEEVQSNSYKERYETVNNRLEYLKYSADFHLKNGNVNQAVEYYKKIFEYREWALHTSIPRFIVEDGYSKETVSEFLEKLGKDAEDFGQNKELFLNWLED